MVKQIVRDVFFLGQPSEPATKADIQVGKDLQDTLQANRERCVGMAANMIGVKKNIIIVNMGFIDVVMFNPVIVSKRDMYETEEAVCPWTVFVRRPDTRKLKWNIMTLTGKNSARNCQDGQHRFASMKLIICLERLFNCMRIANIRLNSKRSVR